MKGRVLFRLWLGLFLAFVLFAHGNLESTDSAFTMHAARALLVRGDAGLRPTPRGPEWVAEKMIADHIVESGQYGMLGDNRLAYVWFPIGHEWVMLPALLLGEFLQRQIPQVERDYRQLTAPGVHANDLERTLYPYGQFVFDQALVALLPALFGAGSVILLLLLAQSLGANTRQALLSAGVVALCSQFFPLTRENLSDGPGMFFLLAGLLGVVRYHKGTIGVTGLVLTGLCCGGAVLTRYPHALLVMVLGAFTAVTAVRNKRPGDLLAFVLGGLPCLVLMCAVNWMRFGKFGETGYGNQALAQWFNYPPWLGLPKILIAGGKGILWFSPLLWLCVPGVITALRGPLRWLALLLFALPLLMFSSTNGWQSGQCWGIRYVTPGVVALLALVLPVQQPWRRHPRTFALLCGLGVVVNVTSLLAPTRGQNQLAAQAVEAVYRQDFERGRIGKLDLDDLDHADHYFFLPQFSPLHSHWTYAWLALRGELEDGEGRPRQGAEHNILPMFGVDPQALQPMPERRLRGPLEMGQGPQHWEDRSFRHLWWRFWADLLGISSLWLLLPAVLLAAFVIARPLRSLARAD